MNAVPDFDTLQRSEERLRLALDAGRVIAWERDLETGSVMRSGNAEAITGVPSGSTDEFINRIHPEDRIAHDAAVARAAAEGAPYCLQVRFIRPDGEVIWLENRGHIKTGSNGRRYLVGTSSDITAHKRAEQAAEDARALLQATLENMEQGLIMMDERGIVQVFNNRAAELLNLPPELLAGHPSFEDVRQYQLDHNDFEKSDEAFRTWVATSGLKDERDLYERERPDGTVLEIRTIPLANGGAVRTYTDVTARKVAEREAREKTALLQATLETMDQGLIMVDAEESIHVYNRRVLELLDLPEELMYGRGSYLKVKAHQRSRGEFAKSDAAQRTWLDTGDFLGQAAQYERERPDGTILEVRSVPRNEGGAVRTFTDVTKRRQAELAVRQSEERYRALVSATSTAFWRASPDGRVIQALGWESYCGQEPENWLDAVHPDDRDRASAQWASAIAGGERSRLEYRLRRKDGEYRWVLDQGAALRDANGAVLEWVGAITDIHEQKVADEVLWETNQLLASALRAARMVAWEWDLTTGTVKRSDTSFEVLGLPSGEISGFLERVHPDDRPAYEAAIDGAARGAGSYDIEYRFHKAKGQTVWLRETGQVETSEGQPTRARGLAFDITRRKEAEASLQRSDERLRLATEATALGTYDVDLRTGEREWSHELRAILGVPTGERATRDLFRACVHPDDLRLVDELFLRNTARPGEQFKGEFRVVGRARDRLRWVAETARTIADESGQPIRYIGTLQDITERKTAELAAQESERRFRHFAEIASDWFWEYDEQFRYTSMAGREVLVPLSRVIGQTRWEALGADPESAIWKAHIETLRAHKPFRNFEHLAVSSKGDEVWLSSNGDPLFDNGGNFTGYRGVSRDITNTKTSELAAYESEARYRLLAENTNDMIVRADTTALRLYVSPGCYDIVGYWPEELIGTRPFDFVHPDDEADLRQKLGALGRGESERLQTSYRLRHRDGHWVSVEVSFRLVRSPSGEPSEVISVTRDVTARMQLEERLRQSQKMEAVGQLTGGVAHDFNNLLTVILGNAEVLVGDPANSALTRAASQMILEAAEKGAELTQHLLAFGRRQSLKPVRLSVDHVVKGMMPLLKRTIGEHIELKTDFSYSLFSALTDRALLESAILNLAVNAKDAMPNGGTLTISTGERLATASDGALTPGQELVHVTVSDTGTGMTPEVVERAFEPFFTTKEVGKGSGLGLSMVYGFAQQSGGHVSISSKEGEGTAVSIILPAVTTTATTAKAASDRPSPELGKERVLLVEDEPQVLQFVLSQLLALGYEVTAVSTALDALELLQRDQAFDLLFTDVVLPRGISGAELAMRARKIRPELKVLLTSGYPEEAFEHHGRPEGSLLLRKPYRRHELADTVRKVLDQVNSETVA